MTIVSSIQANSSERQYAFASAESPVIVVISVPRSYGKVFNKKVLDKKTPSVV